MPIPGEQAVVSIAAAPGKATEQESAMMTARQKWGVTKVTQLQLAAESSRQKPAHDEISSKIHQRLYYIYVGR